MSEQCVNSQSQTVLCMRWAMYLFKDGSQYRGRHLFLNWAESDGFMAAEECALLPAVLDGNAVFESNYSMVGFSRNVVIFFKESHCWIARHIRWSLVPSWESVAAITRHYKRHYKIQSNMAVFTMRGGLGGSMMALPGMKQSPHISAGEMQEESV